MAQIPHYEVRSRQPGQKKCLLCRKWLNSPQDCLDIEAQQNLSALAISHGSRWRCELQRMIEQGNEPEWARRVRNVIPPSDLKAVKTDFLVRLHKKLAQKHP